MHALKTGYRLIDTATIYGNEESVGRAIQDSGIARKDIFVTTKLWNNDQGKDSAPQALKKSLDKLGLEYVDLYLIHWPVPETRVESWHALEELQKQGLALSIGVSNFMVKHLKELLDASGVVPAVNQIELHPFNYKQRQEVVEFCREHDIVVEAYSPLAQATKLDNPVIAAVAGQVDKAPTQVMLRWAIQKGTIPLPKSATPEHIEANFNVFDFELKDTQMAELDSLNEDLVLTMNPDNI